MSSVNETATLQIKVDSSDPREAARDLDKLTNSSIRAEKSTDGLMAAFKRLAGPAVLVATAYKAFNKALDTTVTFENFNAQLKTATGSAENAKIAFDALLDFANDTPYGLEQAINAFIQLTNRGLTPSEAALRSYGNTASALGYTLEEVVYAVSAAAAGEFEPLRKFGIQARKEAEGLAITFQGSTTRIKNDIRSVEEYFQSLGNNQFAGGMEERMKTLGGKISQLGDAWDQLFATIGDHQFGDLVKQGVDLATESLQNLTDMIKSGELGGYIDALRHRFSVFADDAKLALESIGNSFEVDKDRWAASIKFVADMFLQWPENVRAAVEGIGAWVGMMILQVELAFKNLGKHITAEFDLWQDQLKAMFNEIDSWGTGKDFNYTDAILVAQHKYDTAMSTARKEAKTELDAINAAYGETVTGIMNERDAILNRYDAEIAAAKKLRAEYEENARVEKALQEFFGEDRTARFRVGEDKPKPMQTETQMRQYEYLKASLMSEEQLVEESYQKRRQLILDNTEAGDAMQAQLLAELDLRRESEDIAAGVARANRLEEQYITEQMQLQAALDAKQISEQEFHERSKANWASYTKDVGNIVNVGANIIKAKQLSMQAQVLSLASDLSTNLATLAKEDTAAAKALFVASKAISIAQAIVNTELAATRAMAEGGLYLGIPMSSIIRGLGYASVAIMAGTAIGQIGQFEHGGQIPAGGYGLVGETGMPELVKGPAIVTSADRTKGMLKGSNGDGEKVTVLVNNYGDATATVKERESSDGKIIEVTIERAVERVANDITEGTGRVSRALQSTYPLRRGAA